MVGLRESHVLTTRPELRVESRQSRAFCAMILALSGALGVCCACGDTPRQVLANARSAAVAGEFDEYSEWFTERSRALMLGLREAAADSRGRFVFLSDRDLLRLLPEGEVHDEERRGALAILRVGRTERTAEEVILLRELDGWRIDIFDSPRFWRPLVVIEQQP